MLQHIHAYSISINNFKFPWIYWYLMMGIIIIVKIIMIDSGNTIDLRYYHFWQLAIERFTAETRTSLAIASKIFRFSVKMKCDFEK